MRNMMYTYSVFECVVVEDVEDNTITKAHATHEIHIFTDIDESYE